MRWCWRRPDKQHKDRVLSIEYARSWLHTASWLLTYPCCHHRSRPSHHQESAVKSSAFYKSKNPTWWWWTKGSTLKNTLNILDTQIYSTFYCMKFWMNPFPRSTSNGFAASLQPAQVAFPAICDGWRMVLCRHSCKHCDNMQCHICQTSMYCPSVEISTGARVCRTGTPATS